MKYQVWSEYMYAGKWRNGNDRTTVTNVEDAHATGKDLIKAQRAPITAGGLFTLKENDAPRRYCIAEFNVLHTSEEM